jgi:hypothetical protein
VPVCVCHASVSAARGGLGVSLLEQLMDEAQAEGQLAVRARVTEGEQRGVREEGREADREAVVD